MSLKNNNKKVFLDTTILIPLMDDKHHNHLWAREIQGLYNNLCIDTVVLAELLPFHMSDPEREKIIMQKIRQGFQIYSLSPRGSRIAALIYKICRQKNIFPVKKEDADYILLRADVIILASAIEYDADAVISEDRHWTKIINAIRSEQLPFAVPLCMKLTDVPFQHELGLQFQQ